MSTLCPALVATGVSDEGADPAEVAAEALRTVEDGSFAAVPREWRAAVVEQARRTAEGELPLPPEPSGTDG